jgi:hypothetical protein
MLNLAEMSSETQTPNKKDPACERPGLLGLSYVFVRRTD